MLNGIVAVIQCEVQAELCQPGVVDREQAGGEHLQLDPTASTLRPGQAAGVGKRAGTEILPCRLDEVPKLGLFISALSAPLVLWSVYQKLFRVSLGAGK